jgi:hypothetical protein
LESVCKDPDAQAVLRELNATFVTINPRVRIERRRGDAPIRTDIASRKPATL